jgi:hypothetical protein
VQRKLDLRWMSASTGVKLSMESVRERVLLVCKNFDKVHAEKVTDLSGLVCVTDKIEPGQTDQRQKVQLKSALDAAADSRQSHPRSQTL